MRKTYPAILLLILMTAFMPIEVARAQEPSLRFLTVEGLKNTTVKFGGVMVPAIEVNFTFALTNVDAGGDKCNFLQWKGLQNPVVIGNFSLGFSGDPPKLQGIYSGTGILVYHILSAEFPYGSQTVDGILYYYYRIHLYIDSAIIVKDTFYFGGAYLVQPTLEGSSLVRVKVKDVVDGVAVFKDKVVHDG